VYDLTVDKAEHFVVNGVVVHNCKHLGRVRDYIVNMLYGGRTADQLGRLVTLTRTPVVLGGKRVPTAQQPSTKLPPKKPAEPAKPATPTRVRVGRVESVVRHVNHNQDLKDWARLFEDDTAPGGIVTNDSEKLDKLLDVVTELVTKIDALASTEVAGAESPEGDVLPDGAIELDLGTGEPKPGEPKLEITGGNDDADAAACPPCANKDMVPEAPDTADLEADELEDEAAELEDEDAAAFDLDELEKAGKDAKKQAKKPAKSDDEAAEEEAELDGEQDEG
jgi:hypothetical protein